MHGPPINISTPCVYKDSADRRSLVLCFYSAEKRSSDMKITVYARKVELTPDLESSFEKKLSKYDRYFKEGAEAFITVSHKRGFSTVELTINSSGTIFRSEQSERTFLSAFDNCIAAIERQIRKNKTRLNKKLREGVFVKGSDSAMEYNGPEYEEEGEFSIRYKSFKFKPMSTEEAILQMNLSEHDFYVYKNDQTGEVNIVYKRKDGDYGCIVPV